MYCDSACSLCNSTVARSVTVQVQELIFVLFGLIAVICYDNNNITTIYNARIVTH